ncbi:MAG: IS481 family transposase [Burkholderiales bacterium]
MHDDEIKRGRDAWARLRFAVVGPLLAAPPRRGELEDEIARLAEKSWRHPRSGEPVRFGRSTIERWLAVARRSRDPVAALGRAVRRDAGEQPSLSLRLRQLVREQHEEHPSWTVRLHYDNLLARLAGGAEVGSVPSYQSVRRFMQAQGLHRVRRVRRRAGSAAGHHPHPSSEREIRSYEVAHTHALWHADFHHGSHQVLSADGSWATPRLLGFLDDHSRLCCHLQWYLEETAECFVHGLGQAILKRGLPRALLTDNGAAMLAAETTEGLGRLGIVHERTLAYAAYQNAKQEVFWAQVEGRLVAMLEGVPDLTLARLNEATQAWVELEYHRHVHRELATTPLARYLGASTLGRPSPSPEELRRAFRAETVRTQRRSDGTISLLGRRFEVPARLRHLGRIHLRYAGWDLSSVDVVDRRTGEILTPLYPLDKRANASGRRRRVAAPAAPSACASDPPASGMAPLLAELLAEYSASGLPPAYLPKEAPTKDEKDEEEK